MRLLPKPARRPGMPQMRCDRSWRASQMILTMKQRLCMPAKTNCERETQGCLLLEARTVPAGL